MKKIEMDYAEYEELVRSIDKLKKFCTDLEKQISDGEGAVITWSGFKYRSGSQYGGYIELPEIESSLDGFKTLEKKYGELKEQVLFGLEKAYKEGYHDGAKKEAKLKRKWYQIF
tara:strand:+ start:33 stop:374 length:342 start_codon:yes stop_codon:yes gene_type:complete